MEKTDERRGWTSASNAAADRLCEGRHQAQIGIEDISSEDAAFGQQIHDALFKGSSDGLKPEQVELYDQHQAINEKLMSQFFGNDREAAIVVKENRYWCSVSEKAGGIGERLRHSAKPDFIARHGTRVLIVEYKSLPGDVPEPSKNEQLRDQTVIVSGTFGIRENCEVGTAVNQPLVTHSPELCVYHPEDIKLAEREMFDRVRNSNKANPTRTAGAVQCKFCKARFKCKEYAAWAESLMPVATKVVGLPTSEWTPDMWAYYLEMRGNAKKWLEEADAEAKRKLEEDAASIPGWKLAPGATQSTIVNPQELFRRFVEVGREWATKENAEMHPEHTLLPLFMECVKVGKMDMQALVRKVTGEKGKILTKTWEDMLAGIIEEKQNKPSLAKMTTQELMSQAKKELVDAS